MERTEQEIEVAYKVARKLANSVVSRVRSSHSHYIDFDDYVQEGVLAWLEGRNMYRAMMEAFVKAAKMSKYSFNTKGMKEPRTVDIDSLSDVVAEEENVEAVLVQRIDANRVLQRILAVSNEQVQFALLAYLYIGMSLREISQVFGKSHEWVRTYLIEPELARIKEDLKC